MSWCYERLFDPIRLIIAPLNCIADDTMHRESGLDRATNYGGTDDAQDHDNLYLVVVNDMMWRERR